MIDDLLHQVEGYLDATDTVEVYSQGKTWECPCGHGIGTELRQESVKCAKCDTVLVDTDHESRVEQAEEIRERGRGQQTLDQFT